MSLRQLGMPAARGGRAPERGSLRLEVNPSRVPLFAEWVVFKGTTVKSVSIKSREFS